MRKIILAIACLGLAMSVGLASAEAASTKSPAKKKTERTFTPEQRHKIMLQALELCRKKYGRASLHHAEMNYRTMRVKCYIY